MNTVVSVASLASAAAISAPALAETPIADPIFKLIDRHRKLFVECSAEENEKGHDALCTELYEVADEILKTVPRTVSGAAAGLHWLLQHELGVHAYTECHADFVRRVADALDRLSPSSAKPVLSDEVTRVEDDPIYALLKEHDLAWCKFQTAMHRYMLAAPHEFRSKSANREFNRAQDAMWRCYDKHKDVLKRVIGTKPTTKWGVTYKLQHLDRISQDDTIYDDIAANDAPYAKVAFQALVNSLL